MARILIVDDDTAFRESLAEMLGDLGHAVSAAPTVAAGLQVLQAGVVDVAIVDLRMPGEDGLAFLRKARGLSRAPCIMLTAYASGSNTIEAMRLGAFDHLTKPIARTALVEVLERALHSAGQAGSPENAAQNLSQNPEQEGDDAELVSGSEAMRQVFKRIGLAADSDATVLVLGETGTGKELVARALHRNSARAERPFVAVNCAAIPADLMESELFGHVKGAFTSAASSREGLFFYAQGGTLFLDEIAELPLALQAKLLRVIEDRKVRPVGSDREIPIDVRLIAATNADLAERVAGGQFRADLYYRLDVVRIHLPPLRERVEDIEPLARMFMDQLSAQLGLPPLPIPLSVLQRFEAYPWPGNARELRNRIERALILGTFGEPVSGPTAEPRTDDLAEVEKRHILRVLAASEGNRAEAARRLGVSRKTLDRKCAEWNV